MIEKNCIRIGNHVIECTDPTMSYKDWVTWLEDTMMEEMEESLSGDLLVPLYDYFDTEKRPLSIIEFCDFWARLDPFEQGDFLLFSENDLVAVKGK